jgi:hypothetical protein
MLLGAGVLLGHFVPNWLNHKDDNKRLPDVITQVRELSRLEGVSYHVERVVDLHDQQEGLFGLVKAEDAILLVASGDVVAGVDLSKLQPGDIVISADKQSVTVHLPPAEVFSARLDSEHTYVHTRKTDLLARRKESLETEARKAAEKTLQGAAEDAGIVRKAEESVGRTVRSLVRSLGFTDVRIDFRARA